MKSVPKNLKLICTSIFLCLKTNFWSFWGHAKRQIFFLTCIYIYRSDCLYLCPLFTPKPPHPISTKFCTDLPTNSGKVLITSMTAPTRPPGPRGTPNSGVPQTPKPKQVKGEKTLHNAKCPDGWSKLIKFFPGSTGARLASIVYM